MRQQSQRAGRGRVLSAHGAWLLALAMIAIAEHATPAQEFANDIAPRRPLTTAPFDNPFVTQERAAKAARVNALRFNADDDSGVVGTSALAAPPLPQAALDAASKLAKESSDGPPAGTAAETPTTEAAALAQPVPEQPADSQAADDAAPPQELPPESASNLLPAEPSTGGAAYPLQLPTALGGPEKWLSPEGISSALEVVAMLAVVSLAPAILLMTTCFVRITVVLGLLRQALGTGQLPPNQVMTSIALFMTLLIMSPVWNRVYTDAIKPYAAQEISATEAWDAGVKPVRQFMSAQIDRTGNRDDVWLFYKYLPEDTPEPSSYDEVPLTVLLPAFMLSELKTAFLIGFQIYLPFLVLDLVVSSITISMGMMMLPPVMVSLPFKLLLFVLVDGWHLVVGMLLDSFQPFS